MAFDSLKVEERMRLESCAEVVLGVVEVCTLGEYISMALEMGMCSTSCVTFTDMRTFGSLWGEEGNGWFPCSNLCTAVSGGWL